MTVETTTTAPKDATTKALGIVPGADAAFYVARHESVISANAVNRATGKFGPRRDAALLALVELGLSASVTSAAWADIVAAYGDAMTGSTGKVYLSHVRKAIRFGYSVADIRVILSNEDGTMGGISSLPARIDALNAPADDTSADDTSATAGADDTSATAGADTSKLLSALIRNMQSLGDLVKSGAHIDADQWQALAAATSRVTGYHKAHMVKGTPLSA